MLPYMEVDVKFKGTTWSNYMVTCFRVVSFSIHFKEKHLFYIVFFILGKIRSKARAETVAEIYLHFVLFNRKMSTPYFYK